MTQPGITRTAFVMASIRTRIASRGLMPGARLPSVRALATTLKVSTSTVVDAYERLVAEGAIRSRPGSGFYVSGPLAPLALAEIAPRLDRAVDPLWISRQSLDADAGTLKPGCGWLPESWMPQAGLRRALKTLSRGNSVTLTDYGAPLGPAALRQVLSRRMADQDLHVPPERILLTDSGTQAIDLVCRFLLETSDCVLIDDPCYFNFHALLHAHRARIVGVPMTPDGPDVQAFAEVVASEKPRLYITNSGIHNPTGAVLSPVAAHRLLKIAEQAQMIIVEDDIFADFENTPAPRLAAFDGLDRVVRIGSFSKTLSASIRCGYIAARPDWIEGLSDLRIATSFGSNRLSAELVLTLLTDGSYRKHVQALRTRLAAAMQDAIARLAPLGITPWLIPDAGMFLWCRLPEGADAAAIARTCLAHDIILAPGNAFSLSRNAGSFMRFNVAQMSDPRIFTALARALDA